MRQFTAKGAQQLATVALVLQGLSPDKTWRIQITPHRIKRTPEQNELLWAIYTEMAFGTGHTPEEIHEAMKRKFLPPKFVKIGEEEVGLPGSTAVLDVKEFSAFVERVQAFAAQELGIVV